MALEILKVIFLGIVEGITEWLPISSTGHMLLVDEFLHLNASDGFKEVFFIVIQLGAILAVVLLFWDKMFPFARRGGRVILRTDVFSMWCKVVVACIPGAAVTLLFDDWVDSHLHTPVIIAAALIVYGVGFIIVERHCAGRRPRVRRLWEITYRDALIIGLFQMLSIVPGTSRSGSTIIGALLIGISRVAAAEFTFFLAVPVMFGYSALKLLKFGLAFTSSELVLLLVGAFVAFAVSFFAVGFLMRYIRKHSFSAFGVYRIILGIAVIVYFTAFAG